MVLLWTNASPQSAFAAQTIQLDLSKYAQVGILVERYGICIAEIGKPVSPSWNNNWSDGSENRVRLITANANNIIFSDANMYNVVSKGYKVITNDLRPLKIYGIQN